MSKNKPEPPPVEKNGPSLAPTMADFMGIVLAGAVCWIVYLVISAGLDFAAGKYSQVENFFTSLPVKESITSIEEKASEVGKEFRARVKEIRPPVVKRPASKNPSDEEHEPRQSLHKDTH